MRGALFFFAACFAFAQTTINFVPGVITQCAPTGLGSGTVSWSYLGTGPVQVRVGGPDGPALTGLSGPQGSATTGDWVADGMVFVLVDGGLRELARITARVRCNAASEVLLTALANASYFPLQIGDEWVYAFNSRISTSAYVTRRISRTELVGDTAWFVLEDSLSGSTRVSESLFRSDDAGRIYQLTNRGEQLWLDPVSDPNPSALLKVTGRGLTVRTPAGRFQNGLAYQVINGNLDRETGTFARGIGLVINTHVLMAGSSGGFSEGLI